MSERIFVAPRIETERLILREFRVEDFDAYCAIFANPDVAHFTGGAITDRSAAWEKFARGPGFWALFGYGLWIVEEKGSGRFAGNVGFGQFERGIEPPLPGVPEAAWVLDAWAHGKGFAHEAMSAALAWCDRHIGSDQVCIISTDNRASLKLADKLGFRETRRAPFKGEPTIVLERPGPR